MNTIIESNKTVNPVKLERKVKNMYSDVALHPEEEYHFEMGRALAERLGYPIATLGDIPKESIDSFAGVGYYFDLADLKEGEFVLDMGSGSGMDVFIAAKQVGYMGEVIGIDMTDAQLDKSIALRDESELKQSIFLKSYIEELPVMTGSLDVVVSNGVVNLSSDKRKVFEEAARVLRPGGRLALSDIVSSVVLPQSISCSATLWAACIGGAMQYDEYKKLIEESGFEIVKEKDNPYSFISNSALGATEDYGIKSISLLAVKK
jgi:arsenite methyltransferase